MATRVTPEELIRMHQLYNKYHSYAEVARQTGRSASCVRNNILMKTAPKVVRDTFPDTARKYADESSSFIFCAKADHDR